MFIYRDVFGVQQMTYAVDKSQLILLRANYLSKCGFPEYQVLLTHQSIRH